MLNHASSLPSAPANGSLERARRAAPAILFWAGMLLLAVGWIGNALWRQIGNAPELALIALALLSALAAWGLGRLLRCRFTTALLAVWLTTLACCAGFASSVAIMLLTAAALAIGSCIVPARWPARVALSALVGITLMAGVVGWTLPFPVPRIRLVYLIVLTLIVAWRWRELGAMLRPLPEQWSAAVRATPVAAGAAVMLLGVVSTHAWLPTIMYDDLVYHLGLPAQLASLGYYQMNAGSNVWALAAWSADVWQGIAWVVADGASRGVVNMLWFAMSEVLLWRLCKELDLGHGLRWLAVALFASTPLLAGTLASMQTEGPTAAVVLGLALLIQRSERTEARSLVVAGVLFGLLVGLKVSNLWFALPLGLWLLWQSRLRLPWRALPLAVLAAVVVAGSSYVYAWVLTGNPVLPLFNNIFHSPFYPSANFHDARWDSGFGAGIVWQIVFHTSDYLEGQAGAVGFFLIGLAGSFFVALARPNSRALALVAAVALLLPLAVIQYVRYAAPGIALLIPAMLCGLPALTNAPRHRWMRSAALWLLVVLGGLFLTTAAWQFKTKALQRWLGGGDIGVYAKYAPSRLIAQVIRHRHGDTARVLMLPGTQPFVAELSGKGFSNSWYDPRVQALLDEPDARQDAAPWLRAIQWTGANLLITSAASTSPGLHDAIAKSHGTLVYATGDLELWQLRIGSPGVVVGSSGSGLTVAFDTSDTPPRQTLVHGELTLTCQTHPLVIDWHVRIADGHRLDRRQSIPCASDGQARATFDAAAAGKVERFEASAKPASATGARPRLLASRARFRVDRAAANDLARKLRRKLAFW